MEEIPEKRGRVPHGTRDNTALVKQMSDVSLSLSSSPPPPPPPPSLSLSLSLSQRKQEEERESPGEKEERGGRKERNKGGIGVAFVRQHASPQTEFSSVS